MKSIERANVKGKKVLVRGDLDVPIQRSGVGDHPSTRSTDAQGRLEPSRKATRYARSGSPLRFEKSEVLDDFRIKTILPTLRFLMGQKAKVILCGHLDRPGGKVIEELRMDPVAKELLKHLGTVRKLDDCVGSEIEKVVNTMEPGDIILLENLRFHPEEGKNDFRFAKRLVSLVDMYVNEAFASCYHEQASIIGVPKLIPAYAGLRLMEEVETLTRVLENPKRPLIFIIGGVKEKEKSAVVKGLSRIADKILLGGLLMLDQKLEGTRGVVFPVDSTNANDIGPKSIEIFTEIIKEAKTIIWAGPVGKFEDDRYAAGTQKIAEALAAHRSARTIAGGGDTSAALDKFGVRGKIGFVSTGGTSMLRFLAGEELPGLKALEN